MTDYKSMGKDQRALEKKFEEEKFAQPHDSDIKPISSPGTHMGGAIKPTEQLV